ncbi:hypothetical protein OS493_020016 [Desmophyllum pertusum]|uniref:Uncharacterized protein n=1 Tax=Desmophyllum pertusum TaxID=174260 RepID=A0A9W9YBJ6_9CNID|nr:hypothetical protein OS493_020016 [Desmophyllum pertusum]
MAAPGDHLVRKSSSSFGAGGLIKYEHHFLCTGSECDGGKDPSIIITRQSPGDTTEKTLVEAGSAMLRTIWHGLQQVWKIGAELADDVAVAVGRVTSNAVGKATKVALPRLDFVSVSAVTVVVEAFMAGYDIRNAYKKWKDGVLIESREEFIRND